MINPKDLNLALTNPEFSNVERPANQLFQTFEFRKDGPIRRVPLSDVNWALLEDAICFRSDAHRSFPHQDAVIVRPERFRHLRKGQQLGASTECIGALMTG